MTSAATTGNAELQQRALSLAGPALLARGVPVGDLAALRDHVRRQAEADLASRMNPRQRKAGAPGLPLEMLAAIVSEFRAHISAGATQATAAAYTARKLGTTKSLPRTAQRRLFRQLRAADPMADADTLHFRMEGLIAAATEAAALKPPSICGRSAA